jgi:transposase-like protein
LNNHFTLSVASRGLDFERIERRSDEQVFDEFVARRFAANGGKPICPHCKGDAISKVKGREMLRCKPCDRQFSPRKGTEQYKKKVSLWQYEKAVAYFSIEPKGMTATKLSHILNVQYKTAYRLLQKLRNALLPSMSLERFVEDVKKGVAEKINETFRIDGMEVGGYVRPKNVKKKKTDHRKVPYRAKEKEHAFLLRVDGGRLLISIHKHEKDAKPLLRPAAKKGTTVHADSASHWRDLKSHFDLKLVNHKVEYVRADGANTNSAESVWSMVRRAENGTYHHLSGVHLFGYIAEIAWRQENNRVSDLGKYQKLQKMLLSPIAASPRFNRNVKKSTPAAQYKAAKEAAAMRTRQLAFAT